MNLYLTKENVEILLKILYNHNVCSASCILPHMQETDVSCQDCDVYWLENRLINELEEELDEYY